MTMIPRLHAQRSTKRPDRILCGARYANGDYCCSGHFTDIKADDFTGQRYLRLGDGWERGDDGVFKLSPHGKHRYDRSDEPRDRRVPHAAGDLPDDPGRSTRVLPSRRRITEPISARCPRCGKPNVIDPGELLVG